MQPTTIKLIPTPNPTAKFKFNFLFEEDVFIEELGEGAIERVGAIEGTMVGSSVGRKEG
jgi:hypothetical protein